MVKVTVTQDMGPGDLVNIHDLKEGEFFTRVDSRGNATGILFQMLPSNRFQSFNSKTLYDVSTYIEERLKRVTEVNITFKVE